MPALSPVFKLSATAILLIVLIGLYFALEDSEYLRLFTEPNELVASIRNLGALGPILIIALMSMAVVLNPLPSAPVALTAGAVYGHTLGTIYVVSGAELGALLAFLIARWAGYGLTRKFFDESGALQRISSQNTLTMLVFVSRLVPFMSFDLMSYAAGLSPIKLWRFALATLLGLIPVSFALAHFGAAIGDGEYEILLWLAMAIGALTVAPFLLRLLRSRRAAGGPENPDSR